jgi:hypothetical protein
MRGDSFRKPRPDTHGAILDTRKSQRWEQCEALE